MQKTVPGNTFIAERVELCEQVLDVMAAQGIFISSDIHRLMTPLLEGAVDFAQHREMLNAELKRIGA